MGDNPAHRPVRIPRPGRFALPRRWPAPDPGLVLAWIVRAGVLLVLATPLVVAPAVFSPFVVGKAVYARSIIEVTAAVWVALALFDRRRRPSWSWTTFAFAVWLLVSALAGAFGVGPTRSLWSTYDRMQGTFDLAHWFLFTLMAGSVFRGAADWRLLLGVNLAVSSVACGVGLAHHHYLVDVDLFGDPSNRMSATLGNPAFLGAYAMVNAVVGTALVVESFGRPSAGRRGAVLAWVRGLWGGMALVNLWVLWLTATRGAVVGLGAAGLVFAAYGAWGRLPAARRAAGAVLAAAVVAAVLVAVAMKTRTPGRLHGTGPMSTRLSAIGTDRGSSSRIAFAAAGLRAFLDRPVLGWGPENFVVAWGRHGGADAADGFDFTDYPHNKPIEELATKGILGLLSYLALWTVMASVLFRSLRRLAGWEQLGVYLVGAALVSYFVQNLFLFDTAATLPQFALLAAFVAALETGGRRRLPAVLRARLERAAGWLTPARAAALTAAAALLAASLVFVNARAYSAASALADAVRTPRPWPDRRDDFLRSIREFPGLANHPRRHFAAAASAELGGLSEADFRRTVALVTAAAGRGVAAEPRNWRFAAVLAVFYQIAAGRDPEHLSAARRHLDQAAALAPDVPVILAVADEQARLEAAVSGPLPVENLPPPTTGPPGAAPAPAVGGSPRPTTSPPVTAPAPAVGGSLRPTTSPPVTAPGAAAGSSLRPTTSPPTTPLR